MSDSGSRRARASWSQARHDLGGDITALEFGDTVSAVALGGQSEPTRVLRLQLGPGALARRHLRGASPGEAAIEAAIAEAEERIMPLRPLVAADSLCVSRDPRIAWIADVLGLPREPWVDLRTDAVEEGFNRWVAIALGRPATQDTLPTAAEFAASLLVLREWLHHLGFAGIRAARTTPGHEAAAAPRGPRRRESS